MSTAGTSGADIQPPTPPWALSQALFAVMGGYKITTRYTDKNANTAKICRLIGSEGVSILAQAGYLPETDVNDIEERSNADIFAKGLVLAQIIWFAFQVIGRLAQGLSVTPLETHTAIHVGCTIVVYATWMQKPYNLTQSIRVDGDEAEKIGALFNFYTIGRDRHRREYESFKIRRVEYWKERVIMAARGETGFQPPPQPPEMPALPQLLEQYQNPDAAFLLDGTMCNEDMAILHSIAPHAARGLDIIESKRCTAFQRTHEHVQTGRLDLLHKGTGNFTIRSVWGSWSKDIGHEPSIDKGLHVLFNVIYGGTHLAAWNAYFPTTSERLIWRIAALTLMSVPLWGGLWMLWWKGVRSNRRILYPIRNGDLDIVAAPMFFAVMVGYIISRCYFLMESLVSLRLLPADAYQTVSWTAVLPHIS